MSLLDLDIKNYDYNDLLNLFKIEKNENRSNILYKLDKRLKKIIDGNFYDYIVVFYINLLSLCFNLSLFTTKSVNSC